MAESEKRHREWYIVYTHNLNVWVLLVGKELQVENTTIGRSAREKKKRKEKLLLG